MINSILYWCFYVINGLVLLLPVLWILAFILFQAGHRLLMQWFGAYLSFILSYHIWVIIIFAILIIGLLTLSIIEEYRFGALRILPSLIGLFLLGWVIFYIMANAT